MNRVKTCIYAIALNEIKFVDQFMDHCQEADLVLVCDTGSTDGTAERLRERGATVYNIVQRPWRFDIPRNTALSLIPLDIDICLSIDLDEFLQPGWSSAIDREWQRSGGTIKRIAYDYIWNWQEDGVTPAVRFFTDKIHHRRGFRWKHPCHETLYWEGEGKEIRQTIPDVVLHHRADTSKSRGQYLHLLKIAVDEDPTNDRMAHYYARELMFQCQYAEAVKQFDLHLSLPTAVWKEERCASWRYKSRCQRALNDLESAFESGMKAILECPNSREPWLELSRVAYAKHDWKTCYWAATTCLAIPNKTASYMNDPNCWGPEPFDYAALAAYNLGLYSEATKHGRAAFELAPQDTRLQKNLEYYKETSNNH